MYLKRLLSALILLTTFCALSLPAHAQLSHSGTHFLFSAFPSIDARKVARSSPPRADVYIISDVDATASIQFPATNPVFTREVSLTGGEFALVQVPTEFAYDWQVGVNSDRSIEVTSDTPVSVLFSNPQVANSDATQVPPTEALGERYFLATYNSNTTDLSDADPYGGFSVTSPHDNNAVTIVPTQDLSGEHQQGQPFEVTLNKGESFVATASNEDQTDLTGTVIASDKPVQVTSGNLCANIPDGVGACDTIFTNNLPVESWGTHYVLSPLPNRGVSLHRAIAAQPNTEVYVNGSHQGTLGTGEHLDLIHEGGAEVTSSNPVGLVKLITGGQLAQDSSASTGDPAIAYITPVAQYRDQYSFALVDFC